MALAASVNTGKQIPKGVAYTRTFFMGVTGLTLTVTISKAGGAFAAAAGVVSEIANGWYKIVYTTVDTGTFGDLTGHATDGGINIEDWSDQVGGVATLADGVAHGGTLGSSTATLALQTINITNPSGSGIVIDVTAPSSLYAGIAISSTSAEVSGIMIDVAGTLANGIWVRGGGDGCGVLLTGHSGDVIGLKCLGLGAGSGAQAIGGLSGGDGLTCFARANFGFGLNCTGPGAGAVMNGLTGSNAQGLLIYGDVIGTTPGLEIQGGNAGPGVKVRTYGVGEGILVTTVNGAAVSLNPVDGNGIDILPTISANTSAIGVNIVGVDNGSDTLGSGIVVSSGSNSDAIDINAGMTGISINTNSGDGININADMIGVSISSQHDGIYINPGDIGINITSSDYGIKVASSSRSGIYIASTSTTSGDAGIQIASHLACISAVSTSGDGISLASDGTGVSIVSSSGNGIDITSSADKGIVIVSSSDAVNIRSTAGTGMSISATISDGIFIGAGRDGINIAADVVGLNILSDSGNNPAISATGSGTGAGFLATGGATDGIGFSGVGGGSGGIGFSGVGGGSGPGFESVGDAIGWPTGGATAADIWQDTTAGDFTVPGSIGLSLAPVVLGTAPGTAGGHFIAGSNAATETFGPILDSTTTFPIGVTVQYSGPNADIIPVYNFDGTCANSGGSTTLFTFPALDSAGNAIADDATFAYHTLQIVGGTGANQVLGLGAKTGVRTFAIIFGAVVGVDNTSEYIDLGGPADVAAFNGQASIGAYNWFNVMRYVSATTVGLLPTGAGSGTEPWKDLAGNPAVTFTCDSAGNRTSATYF